MKAILGLLKEKFKDQITDDLKSEIEAAYEEDVTSEVAGLKAKNGELIATNKKLRQQTIDGAGPEAAATIRELEEARDKLAADLATKDAESRRLTRELDKATKQAAAEGQAVEKMVADGGLENGLKTLGVKAELMPAVKAYLRSKVVVKAEGGERVALFGDKPLLDGLKEWAATDEGKGYIVPPANAGGGAGGSGSGGSGAAGKTMKRSEFQALTPDEQMKTVKENPTLKIED